MCSTLSARSRGPGHATPPGRPASHSPAASGTPPRSPGSAPANPAATPPAPLAPALAAIQSGQSSAGSPPSSGHTALPATGPQPPPKIPAEQSPSDWEHSPPSRPPPGKSDTPPAPRSAAAATPPVAAPPPGRRNTIGQCSPARSSLEWAPALLSNAALLTPSQRDDSRHVSTPLSGWEIWECWANHGQPRPGYPSVHQPFPRSPASESCPGIQPRNPPPKMPPSDRLPNGGLPAALFGSPQSMSPADLCESQGGKPRRSNPFARPANTPNRSATPPASSNRPRHSLSSIPSENRPRWHRFAVSGIRSGW